MVSQAEKQAPAAPDRLRRDIDSGRTGDKVPVTDPAAAPLGTDDEAGGTRLSAHAAAMAQSAEARRKPEPPKEGHMHLWYIGGIVVAALIIITAFMTR